MTARTQHEALVKTVEVAAPPVVAFELFTARMGEWWPLVTHSVYALDAATVELHPGAGGRIVETRRTGETTVWGTVLTWEPGVEVAFTWHPGTDAGEATHVSVRFEPTAAGSRVVLVHDGWQARPDAARARHAYDTGWDVVLGRYAELTRVAPAS
jgi:uncharacterized protein YndB with AHSA1/START domain